MLGTRLNRIGWRAAVLLLGCAVAAGCQTARVAEPLTAELAGNDAEAQLAFWHALAERPVTSNDEALHGLLLYLDGEDAAADYAGRVDALKERGILPSWFHRPADQAVLRGTLATAIVNALQIKGGVTMRVFGPWPRYAVRELRYMNLYPASSPYQTFSGTEFLGIIGRVEDYQRAQAGEPEPAVPQ